MIERLRRAEACCVVAALLLLMLLAPPVKAALEASMSAQMLVQIPLLAAAGALFAHALPKGVLSAIEPWNEQGISSLVLATFAAAFWMLPRSLDAAATDPLMAGAKYLSVPLLLGLPLALAWPRMSFIVRGVFLLECIATLFRLGWLYLVSPERLCNNYLLDDQQRLGRYLLFLGAALVLAIAWKLLWGRFEAAEETSLGRSR
ncbi:MAG TPA: hypothetical protein VFX09_07520 [Burkholderiales bacterium]|nr:hypothetical protein [Burkholderiales bacterium]